MILVSTCIGCLMPEFRALADPPPTVTIAQIQQYQGVSEGDRVRITGVVTCETGRFGYSNTVVNDPAGGPWTGIFVYDVDQRLVANRGDTVEAVGIVTEYYEKTELNTSGEIEYPPAVTGTGSIPAPIFLACSQAGAEMYESCLIQFRDATVVGVGSLGQIVNDGTADYLSAVRDFPIGYTFDCLTGINDVHSFTGEFVLRPRDDDDLACSPTPTPEPSPTPPPPTPTTLPESGTYLSLNAAHFDTGDPFVLTAELVNSEAEPLDVQFWLLLDVYGQYWFYPDWTPEPGCLAYPSFWGRVPVTILAFTWPQVDGAAAGLMFWSALLDPEHDLFGVYASVAFGYGTRAAD